MGVKSHLHVKHPNLDWGPHILVRLGPAPVSPDGDCVMIFVRLSRRIRFIHNDQPGLYLQRDLLRYITVQLSELFMTMSSMWLTAPSCWIKLLCSELDGSMLLH